jgi:predicted PP-loop superfamily ATPase
MNITQEQIYRIDELLAQLKRKPADCTGLTFDQASKAINKLETNVREMKRTQGHIWTEDEVRSRLERYNEDDSMYYAKIPQLKQVVSFGGGVNTADSRIIKRVDLDKAIKGTLLSREVAKTEQIRRYKIYLTIKILYLERSVGMIDAAIVFNVTRQTIYNMVGEAVGLITGYLNAKSLSSS